LIPIPSVNITADGLAASEMKADPATTPFYLRSLMERIASTPHPDRRAELERELQQIVRAARGSGLPRTS
jgi:hypothetical protein